MNTWKPILAALVIFAAGVVTGGLTVRLKNPRLLPPTGPVGDGRRQIFGQGSDLQLQLRDLARRMEKQLDLTQDQREQITALVRDTQSRVRGIVDEVAPRTREEFRQMRERIRAELTPEQRRRFEQIFRTREELREDLLRRRDDREDRSRLRPVPEGREPRPPEQR